MANIRSTAQVETGQPARRAAQYVRMSTDMQNFDRESGRGDRRLCGRAAPVDRPDLCRPRSQRIAN